MRRRGLGPATAACALAALALAAGASAGLGPNPADHRSLVDEPIEGYRYDDGRRCRSHVPDGTRALARWLGRHTRGELWGITRCERWSPGSYSLHAEGRAIDWHMDARNGTERRQAMSLIRNRLLADDRRGNENALARRMGVQGIIFNCKSWWSGPGGLGRYSYCEGRDRKDLDPTAAHIDHIHIELNWQGARERTSFWRSRLARR